MEKENGEREGILGRVRAALEGLPERAGYPEWEDRLGVTGARPLEDRWGAFCERLTAVHGLALERPEELAEYLRTFGYLRGYCDPELVAFFEKVFGEVGILLETVFERERLDEYQFGITRARAAIAETGSVVVTDRGTSSRLGALAPWVHVACFRREEILRDTAEAVADLGDDPNVIWITGPSKTADVEGILIEGVHGPGVQICLLLE